MTNQTRLAGNLQQQAAIGGKLLKLQKLLIGTRHKKDLHQVARRVNALDMRRGEFQDAKCGPCLDFASLELSRKTLALLI